MNIALAEQDIPAGQATTALAGCGGSLKTTEYNIK